MLLGEAVHAPLADQDDRYPAPPEPPVVAASLRALFHVIQVCRYLVKDFGTSQSPKSTRQRDSRYCP
ncbi:MAG: hypothetical protein G8D58_13345, partial [gamma proteobacterium symbiont of Phacoides pectinatus]